MAKTDWKTVRQVFFSFLKIGAFTFGGGYAMIPLIQKEIVEKHGWIAQHDLLDMVAVAESTPGPIAINAATFVGQRTGGFWCAFFATLGVVLPSFLIITAVSYALAAFEQIRAVKYAFWGIRAGVLALMVRALYSMYRECQKGTFSYVVMAAAFIFVAFLGVNVLWVVLFCAAAGLGFSVMTRKKGNA
ncbi:MAG: chromate transporter [Christensenella sp.]|nr:chromate transporter [Christensenella sp.]